MIMFGGVVKLEIVTSIYIFRHNYTRWRWFFYYFFVFLKKIILRFHNSTLLGRKFYTYIIITLLENDPLLKLSSTQINYKNIFYVDH